MLRDDAYWAHIRAVVDAAPPLTAAQLDRLSRIFRPAVVRKATTARREAA